MKLLRVGPAGFEKPALLDEDGQIRDLSAHCEDIAHDTLCPERLQALSNLDARSLPLVDANVRIGPCVGGVGKIVCVGLNYADHALESGLDIPKEPVLFMKPTTAITGRRAKYVNPAQAMDHVAGYCVANDVSERAFQIERGGQWDKGKAHDTFAPIGPWLVTQDEVPHPHDLAMWLDVDGHRYQSGQTKTMIFQIPTLVSSITKAPAPSMKTCSTPPTFVRTNKSTSGTSTTANASSPTPSKASVARA